MMELTDLLRARAQRKDQTAQVVCGALGELTLHALPLGEAQQLAQGPDGPRALLYAACPQLQQAGESLRREGRLFRPSEIMGWVTQREAVTGAAAVCRLSGVEPVPWEEEPQQEEEEETAEEETVSREAVRETPDGQKNAREAVRETPGGQNNASETVREIVRTEIVPEVQPGHVQTAEIVRPGFVQKYGTNSLISEQMFHDLEGDTVRQSPSGAIPGRENQTLIFQKPESVYQCKSETAPEQAEDLHQIKSELQPEQAEGLHQIKSELRPEQAEGLHQIKSELRPEQAEGLHQIKSELRPEQAEDLHQIKSEFSAKTNREMVLDGPAAEGKNARETVREVPAAEETVSREAVREMSGGQKNSRETVREAPAAEETVSREIVREVSGTEENSRETVREENPAELARKVAMALYEGLRRASLAR